MRASWLKDWHDGIHNAMGWYCFLAVCASTSCWLPGIDAVHGALQGQQIQQLMSTSEVKSSEELQLSKTEATNKYLRLSADFDNFRKRSVCLAHSLENSMTHTSTSLRNPVLGNMGKAFYEVSV